MIPSKSQSTSKTPHKRNPIACLECRRRKVKCDAPGDNQPCRRCIEHNSQHECRYEPVNPGYPNTTPEPLFPSPPAEEAKHPYTTHHRPGPSNPVQLDGSYQQGSTYPPPFQTPNSYIPPYHQGQPTNYSAPGPHSPQAPYVTGSPQGVGGQHSMYPGGPWQTQAMYDPSAYPMPQNHFVPVNPAQGLGQYPLPQGGTHPGPSHNNYPAGAPADRRRPYQNS